MFHLILFQNAYRIFGWMMHILRIQQFLDFSWNTEHFLTCSVMFMYIVVTFGNVSEGAFLWDQDQWSEIIWIVVHELQRNWWICDQSGFITFLWCTMIWMVFDRWSWSRSPQKLWTAFLITCKVPLVYYLHETGMFADTQHLFLILFSVHPRWGEDFSVGLNVCLSFYKKVQVKSG